MRVERLVIEAGEGTLALDLHPRLTVLAGMGQAERDSLTGELIGSLSGARSGVHLELERADGTHLAVFRPTNGRHRLVDLDAARDITAQLVGGRGGCDLLADLGMDVARAHEVMRFTAADLATTSDRGRAVEVLAGLDPRRVWAAAEGLLGAESALATEAEALGTLPEDAEVINAVEGRHIAVERAAERLEATRRHTFWIASASAVGTMPAVLAAGALGFAMLAIAVIAVVASLASRAQLQRAQRAEASVLGSAGASTYLGFQLQRVNSLLGDDAGRKTLMGAAERRRAALAAWQQLAGDIPVAWAIENREEIETAARLRREVDALGSLSETAPDVADDVTDDLAHALVSRLAESRTAGGEGFPLVLDDPFRDLEPAVKLLLLELLGRSAGEPQIVLLTDDEDVASWARLEALTGELSLLEPNAVTPRSDPMAELRSLQP